MSGKESYFVRSEGPNAQAAREAVRWLIERPERKGFLAVHVYGDLDDVIAAVLGARSVKVLKEYGKVLLSGTEIMLVTERKMIWNAEHLPLVAFYPSRKFLDALDSIDNVSAMFVVPWIFGEVELWIRAHNAIELGAAPSPATGPLIKNKVVEEALKGLTSVVNLSTGIVHPRDREATIQAFEILRDGGEAFSPEEVKAWLIATGRWKATDAEEVAKVACAVLERKKLRRGYPVWRGDILEIWRKDAEKL